MASELSEALREAAQLQRQAWKAVERIYAALGYSEFPPEHVSDAAGQLVEEAALSLGTAHERITLFRVRKALEQKRSVVVPVEDQCEFCGEPLGEADENEMRECPECWSKFDKSREMARQG